MLIWALRNMGPSVEKPRGSLNRKSYEPLESSCVPLSVQGPPVKNPALVIISRFKTRGKSMISSFFVSFF